MVPIGFVHDAQDRVILDPDAQVRTSVRLFFQTLGTGSCLAVVRSSIWKELCSRADCAAGRTRANLWVSCCICRARLEQPALCGRIPFSGAPNSVICPAARCVLVWYRARSGSAARHSSWLYYLGRVPVRNPPAGEGQRARLERGTAPWTGTRGARRCGDW